jgi:small subunit ribosomal protein S15
MREARLPTAGLCAFPRRRANLFKNNIDENIDRSTPVSVLASARKQTVINQYRTHATDTGSPQVQIAVLSERIGELTEHFKTHEKDHASRRGLLMMVSRRRRLLDYLKSHDSESYKDVIQKLGIRK